MHDYSGADLVRTFTLGDKIDGGAGTDTLQINVYDDELDIGLASISNVENLLVKNSYDDFDTLNVAKKDFQSVTVDYQGTNHYDNLYINNIKGTTDLTIENVTAYDGYTFYRNYDELYDATAGTVEVTNTLKNFDNTNDYSYYNGYNYFSKATTINHTLNVENADGGETGYGMYVYDYIDSAVDGAVVNSTVNVKNVVSVDDYSDIYVYGSNSATGGKSTYNFTVNIEDSDGIYSYFEAGDSGSSDVITYNVKNHANSNDDSELWSDAFETINLNVTGDSEFTYFGDDGDVGTSVQKVNIVADADFAVTSYTDFDGTSGGVTLTVSGAGNVDLNTTYLGDAGATDVVTVDASAATGDFSIYEINGYAASITSGSGNDTIKVGGFKTAVTTGEGDDKVDTNGFDFGDAAAKKLDGGAGRNTIVINSGALLDAGTAANISNFQVLDITGAAGGDTFDMSVESSLDAVVAKGALDAVVIDKAAAGTTVSLTSADSANSTVASLTYALKTATGTSDNFALSLTASDTDVKDNSKNGNLTVSAVTANAIESFSISSNATTTDGSADGKTLFAAKDYTNTISSLAGDAVKTVTLTGAANLTITDVTATTLTKVDASAMTGKLNITLDASANAAAVAVLGGSAADTITLTGNVAANNIIQGNGGADVITLAAVGTKETVRIASDTDAVLTMTDTTDPVVTPVVFDTIKGYDTVNNFTTGEDKIELSAALGLATGDARSAIAGKGTIVADLTDEAAFAAAVQTLIGTGAGFFNDGAANRAVATAVVDSGTDGLLVLIDTNADGNFTNGTDQAILLSGVTSIVISDIVFG